MARLGRVDVWVQGDEHAPGDLQGGAPEGRSAAQRRLHAGGSAFPVDPIINGSFKSAAAKSGIKLSQLSNDYPSTSRPINVANQAVQIKADVVVSANVLSNLYPQIQEIYKKGCVPMINMFNLPGTTDPAPGFRSRGTSPRASGSGSAAVAIARKNKWPAASIWLVQCGNDAIGKGTGTLNDVNRAFRTTVVNAFKIPKSRVTELNCTSEQDARTKTIDWVTAHPQAKNVISEMWADSLGVAMAQGLESKGFTRKNSIAAGGDASDSGHRSHGEEEDSAAGQFDQGLPELGRQRAGDGPGRRCWASGPRRSRR